MPKKLVLADTETGEFDGVVKDQLNAAIVDGADRARSVIDVVETDESRKARWSQQQFARAVSEYISGCDLRLSSAQTIASGTVSTPAVIIWTDEQADSDNFHVGSGADRSKITIPSDFPECYVTLDAGVQFATNGTGRRVIEIWRNGNSSPVSRKTVENCEASTPTRISTTRKIRVSPGDYFEVYAGQNSGGDLGAQTGMSTYFTMTVDGFVYGNRSPYYRDASFAAKGMTAYADDQSMNLDRVTIVSDPILGARRQVAKFSPRGPQGPVSDIGGGYVRAQAAYGAALDSTAKFFIGIAIQVPEEFAVLAGGDAGEAVMLHEVYGPPFGSWGSLGGNRLWINGDKFVLTAGSALTDEIWSHTFEKGKWYDFVFEYRLSADPGVGYVKLWMNEGAGLSAQSIDGSAQHFYASIVAGVNDGGNNYSTIKVSIANADSERIETPVLFAAHRVGRVGEGVYTDFDPRSYG